MLDTVFGVMFLIYNTFLGNLLLDNRMLIYALTGSIWLFNWLAILYTSFLFDSMTYEGVMTIGIAAIYIAILVPAFIYMTNFINDEH